MSRLPCIIQRFPSTVVPVWQWHPQLHNRPRYDPLTHPGQHPKIRSHCYRVSSSPSRPLPTSTTPRSAYISAFCHVLNCITHTTPHPCIRIHSFTLFCVKIYHAHCSLTHEYFPLPPRRSVYCSSVMSTIPHPSQSSIVHYSLYSHWRTNGRFKLQNTNIRSLCKAG
ncbi:hypothetical protein BD410DRAFT_143902 [Rickenella mellea]|uniref:Uncharacterized protein n=1 Tax=Rickenella mellea TaxID=50990 RepID=A0A4Y7Q7M8_9AGAM|nr:hypothetical protein BD410DRAFT_143902 [Rickenella mellea]